MTPVPARPLDTSEVVFEGDTEIRPCGGCRVRLAVPTADLGRMAACPQCGTVERALACGGPFADVAATPPPRLVATPPPGNDREPLLAPVVPYRPMDPADDRSPMVDAVASLQWVSAAFVGVVTVFQLGRYFKLRYTSAAQDENLVWGVATRVLLAAALVAAGAGVRSRRRAGWGWAVAVSAAAIWGVAGLMAERADRRTGADGWFDFTILALLPSLLISLFTVVVLLTPRYRSEFRTPAR